MRQHRLLYGFISLMFYCFMVLLPSCQWIAHQKQIDSELEDVGIEAARADVEISKKLAEKEIAK